MSVASLAARLPDLRLLTDGLDLFGTDVSYAADHLPIAVAVPVDEGQVIALVQAARDMGLSLALRGGGMSYSAGYLATNDRTVLVDLSAMDRITDLNVTDRYVTVEPGVTWHQLREALRPHGLITPFWGTFSGRHATVGGSVSQGAKFYGSASHGGSAESVLALRVVTGRAEVIATGSASDTARNSPFFRNYGPDLTGMFLGDCGAFGIKTRISLILIPAAESEAYASFSFDDPGALMGAMAQIGAGLLASECSGIDPYTARSRMASQGLMADLRTVGQVVTQSRHKVSGLRDAALIALSGRRFAKRIGYLMSATVEGQDRHEAGRKLTQLRRIARDAGGVPVPASVPRVQRRIPFPPMNTALLTPTGKRMAWLHTVVPNSLGADAFARTEGVFTRLAPDLKQHGIGHGYLLSTHGPTAVGVEALIRWSDAPLPLHLHLMTEAEGAALKLRPDNPAARDMLARLTDAILAEWRDLGGVHVQIGRKYPYFQTRQPPVQALLTALKALHDPDGILSPGNLFSLK
ncbi:FAD-binding oxidoreductase [Gemmobacter sp.]|uniref:FAD-binding oxidoreductase n=1 Tax=Gemmobacter sp. TaxID=1898957 RepID=UPI002AFDD067|nr:FAD-binding oxidoreductase [Gemmobacter sp.]